MSYTIAEWQALGSWSGTYEIVDSAANIQALSDSQLGSMCVNGVTSFDATDDALAFDFNSVFTVYQLGGSFASADVVTMLVPGEAISEQAPSFGVLAATGIDIIGIYGGEGSVSTATALAAVAAGIEFAAADDVTLADAAANIETLTSTDIAALAAIGIDGLHATDMPLRLRVAQALAVAAAGLASGRPSVRDEGAAVSALTTGEIATLGAMGVTALDAIGNAFALTKAQADALGAAAILLDEGDFVTLRLSIAELGAMSAGDVAAYKANGFYHVALADTGAAFAALTPSEFAALAAKGIDSLDATSDVTLSIEQMRPVIEAGIAFYADDLVTVRWGATPQEMASLAAAGVDRIHVNGPVTFQTGEDYLFAMADAGLRFTDTSQVTFSRSGSQFYEGLSVAQFEAFGAIGLHALGAFNSRPKLTLAKIEALIDSGLQWRGTLSFRDSPAITATLTSADIERYAAIGLKDIFGTVLNDSSGFMLSLDFDIVIAMLDNGVVVARNNLGNLIGPARMVATAAEVDSLTAGQIGGIGAANIYFIDLTTGAVSLSAAKAQAFIASGIIFVANDGDIVLSDSGENIAAMSSGQLGILGAIGVDRIDASSEVTLTVEQALAMAASGVPFDAGDTVVISDVAVNIRALTATQILALGALGIDTLAASAACELSAEQLLAVAEAGIDVQDPANVVLGDSAAVISGLSAEGIAAITGLGITKFHAAAAVVLTKAQADAFMAAGFGSTDTNVSVYMTAEEIVALSAGDRADLTVANFVYLASETGEFSLPLSVIQNLIQSGLSLRDADAVTLTGTAEQIADSDSDFADYKNTGVDFLDVATGAATFGTDIAFAALDAGLTFTDGDAITVEADELWDLEDYSFAAVKAVRVDVVAFTSSVELTLEEALSAVQSGLTFTSDDTISIDADAGDIQSIRNLTAAEFTALGNLGVDLLVIPNGYGITLDLEQVLAMANTGMAFGPGFTAYLTTSNFNLEYVTAAQWTALGATGLDYINTGNIPFAFSLAAAQAFAATGINFNGDHTIIITAAPAELSALTEADYSAFASKGFDYFQSTTGAFTVDADQAFAIVNAGLKFVTGDAVTLSATAEAIEALTPSGFAELSSVGVDDIDIGSEAVTLTVDQVDGFGAGLRFKSGINVTVVDTGENLGGAFIATATAYHGILHFDATDDAITVDVNSGFFVYQLGGSFAAEDVVTMLDDGQWINDRAHAFSDLAGGGVDIIGTTNGDEGTVSVATVRAAIAAGLTFAEGDQFTLVDTAAAIAGLSVSDFAAFAETGVDSISSSDDLSLSFAQVLAVVAAQMTFRGSAGVTVTLTPAELASASDLAGMATSGVDIVASDTGAFDIDIGKAFEVVDPGLAFAESDTVTVSATTSAIGAIDAAGFAAYAAAHVDYFNITDESATIAASTARDMVDAGLRFLASDEITLSIMTLSDLGGRSFAALADAGIDEINFVTGNRQISLDDALAAASAGISFSAGSFVSAAASPSSIMALTASQFTALGAAGIDVIAADLPCSLNVAQVSAAVQSGLAFDITLALEDAAASIEALTVGDIAAIAQAGVDRFETTDRPLALSVAQALAAAAGEISVDAAVVEDGAAALSALTVEEIEALGTISITALDAAGGSYGLTKAQADALAAAGIAVAASDSVTLRLTAAELGAMSAGDVSAYTSTGFDTVVLFDTAATIEALTTSEIADLRAKGVDFIDSSTDLLTLNDAQVDALLLSGLALTQADVVTLADAGATLAALTAAQIANLAVKGIDRVDAVDDGLTLNLAQFNAYETSGITLAAADVVTLADTGAALKALTTTQIANLGARGIDTIDATDDALTLNLAQFNAFGTAEVTLTTADAITLADTGANLMALTTAQIADLDAKRIDAIDAIGGWLTLSLAQFNAFGTAEITLAEADTITLADTGANLKALTPAQIANLDAKGIDGIDATDNALTLSLAQFDEFGAGGIALAAADTITLADTGTALGALTTAQIANLDAKGIDKIDATDNALTLSLAQFNAFGTAGITLAAADVVTLADTDANLKALTTAQIANLDAKGVDAIDAIDNALTLSLAQFNAFGTAGITLAAADVMTLADTGANLRALTTAQIANLDAKGIDKVDATNDALTLSLAQLNAYGAAGIMLAAADFVTLADSGAALQALTTAQIANLRAKGIDAIDATDNALALSVGQLNASGTAGIALTAADVVTLADTSTTLKTVTASGIAGLKAKGIDRIDANDDKASLDYYQAKALANAGVAFAAADVVTIADTGARVAVFTATEIAALKTAGVDAIDTTDNALSLKVAQHNATSTAGIALAAADVVTLADMSAALKTVTASGIAALKAKGIDRIDATDNKASLDYYQAKVLASAGIAFAAADVVTVADTGTRIAVLTAAEIAALKTAGVDTIDATDNALSLKVAQYNAINTAGITLAAADVVTLADASTALKAITASGIAGLKAKGIDRIDATDNKASLDYWQAKALAASGLAFAAADVVTVADAGARIGVLTAAEITALKTAGLDTIDATDNAFTFSLAQYAALGTVKIAATDTVTVNGTATADTIASNGADLVLNGKAGNDTLTGGLGDDIFRFDTALGAANVDRIKAFDAAHDRIEIDNAIFKAFAATGAVSVGAFHIGAAAVDAGDRIVYNSATGALSYDSDGTGTAAAITFATLDKGLALTAQDFWIV